jgi:hypothetical protein
MKHLLPLLLLAEAVQVHSDLRLRRPQGVSVGNEGEVLTAGFYPEQYQEGRRHTLHCAVIESFRHKKKP